MKDTLKAPTKAQSSNEAESDPEERTDEDAKANPTQPPKDLQEREAEIARKANDAALVELNTNRHIYDGRGLTFQYQVAPGRKVNCNLGGILESGARVTAELVGGQATLDALVQGGSVLRRA